MADPRIHLPVDAVHLWRIDQRDVSLFRLQEMQGILSEAEREKAARFRFEPSRKTAVISRACLRLLLSRYLSIPPQLLRFVTNAHGKPSLSPSNNLHFNVAHSGDFVMIAAAKTAVGIDIEQENPNRELGMIAQRYFSAWETAVFQQLSIAEQPAAFYRCWTGKEAYLKGIGTGLTTALDSFDVEYRAGKEPQLLQTRHRSADADEWQMYDVKTAVGYTAALAVNLKNRLQIMQIVRVSAYKIEETCLRPDNPENLHPIRSL